MKTQQVPTAKVPVAYLIHIYKFLDYQDKSRAKDTLLAYKENDERHFEAGALEYFRLLHLQVELYLAIEEHFEKHNESLQSSKWMDRSELAKHPDYVH